jgi:hypothetical protein
VIGSIQAQPFIHSEGSPDFRHASAIFFAAKRDLSAQGHGCLYGQVRPKEGTVMKKIDLNAQKLLGFRLNSAGRKDVVRAGVKCGPRIGLKGGLPTA